MGRSQVRRIFRQEGVRWRHTRLWASWASSGSGISYLISDGLGSVSAALTQTGTASGIQLYSPYGTVRYSSGTMPTAKGFTGQYSDAAATTSSDRWQWDRGKLSWKYRMFSWLYHANQETGV